MKIFNLLNIKDGKMHSSTTNVLKYIISSFQVLSIIYIYKYIEELGKVNVACLTDYY